MVHGLDCYKYTEVVSSEWQFATVDVFLMSYFLHLTLAMASVDYLATAIGCVACLPTHPSAHPASGNISILSMLTWQHRP